MKTFSFFVRLLPLVFGFLLLGSCAKDTEIQEIAKVATIEPTVQARGQVNTDGCNGTFTFLGTTPDGTLWSMDVYAAPCHDFANATFQANYNHTVNSPGDTETLEFNHDITYWFLVTLFPTAGATLDFNFLDPMGNIHNYHIEDSGVDPTTFTTYQANCGLRWRYTCPGNDDLEL